jgi:hypothetical protein
MARQIGTFAGSVALKRLYLACLLNVTGFVNVSLKATTRSEYGGLKLAWHRVLTLKMTNVVRL